MTDIKQKLSDLRWKMEMNKQELQFALDVGDKARERRLLNELAKISDELLECASIVINVRKENLN